MEALEKARQLRQKISDLQGEQERAKLELDSIERNCRHIWSELKYTPEYRPGYRIQGDPPGTMGVDWRGPLDVPAETIKRWTRQCQRCGKVEQTERTRDIVTQKPQFQERSLS